MLLMMCILSCSLSITFMFLKHPLTFGLTLLLQTIIISLLSGMLNLNFWFSYILFLIMIGGMLVLFIYMTSVASNEKFKFSNKLFTLNLLSMLMISILFFSDSFFSSFNNANYDYMNHSTLTFDSLNKFVNYPNMAIMILLMIYLLTTLIVVVKITQSNMGPLRQKN
uniref:NADH-ubiquinone oxidoreductase chain 6 n=1 Tax=Leptomias sp. DX-2020 TaxID=2748276 RepID=A0A7D9MYX7_9CUCU|nr:NADH dehydrogenase subunit 6 [Leptomias sp. DX-2020]